MHIDPAAISLRAALRQLQLARRSDASAASHLAHGSMRVELYAPVGTDPQTPHLQDELYFVQAGTGVLDIEGTPHPFGPGTCFFVAAGARHRFERFSADFVIWVVFWGPSGGEADPGSS